MLFHAQTELILAPALLLNVLALICALRRRVAGGDPVAGARPGGSRSGRGRLVGAHSWTRAAATARVNLAFYRFGAGGLALALGLSMAPRML